MKYTTVLIFFTSCFITSILAQEVEKTTAFSIELSPNASFYSTYKNWTRNNQLGIGITFRHYRPKLEDKFFAQRSFLLNLGVYYHEYFVPNTYLGLGYELGNTIKESRWIYQLFRPHFNDRLVVYLKSSNQPLITSTNRTPKFRKWLEE